MIIQEINDKNSWNDWEIIHGDRPSYLQSWEWGEILQSTGQKVDLLAVTEKDVVLAQAMVSYKSNSMIKYAFCPKGPVFNKTENFDKAEVLRRLNEHLKMKGCGFLRMEPVNLEGIKVKVRKTKEINPSATLILNIEKPITELMKDLQQKTRYNLNLAIKKEVVVKEEKNFDVFWELLQKTGQRDEFILHPKESYAKVLESKNVYQLTAFKNEESLATGSFIGFGDTMVYLYGASNHQYRQLMAPYLIQWEAIKLAKKLGFKKYDFFGIAPGKEIDGNYIYNKRHIYAGITRFKLGFGGEVFQEPGTFDLVFSKRYRVYSMLWNMNQLRSRVKRKLKV